MSKLNDINIKLFSSSSALNHFVKKFRKYSGGTIEDSLNKLYDDRKVPIDDRFLHRDKNSVFGKAMVDGHVYHIYPCLTFVEVSFQASNVEDAVTMFSIIASFLVPEGNIYRIYYSSENENDVRYSNYNDSCFGDITRYSVEFYGDEDEYVVGEDGVHCFSAYERLDYPNKFGMIAALNNIFRKSYTLDTEAEVVERDLNCQINMTYEGLDTEYLTDECPWLKKNIDC